MQAVLIYLAPVGDNKTFSISLSLKQIPMKWLTLKAVYIIN